MGRAVQIIDLRELSATDKAILQGMLDRIAERPDIDVGDERSIIRLLVGWYAPNDILRLMDHIAEQARIARQSRVTIGDILGTAALFLLMLAGAIATLIPAEVFA